MEFKVQRLEFKINALDFEFQSLDFEFQSLDFEFQSLDFEFQSLDFEFQALDFEFQSVEFKIQSVVFSIHDTGRQSFDAIFRAGRRFRKARRIFFYETKSPLRRVTISGRARCISAALLKSKLPRGIYEEENSITMKTHFARFAGIAALALVTLSGCGGGSSSSSNNGNNTYTGRAYTSRIALGTGRAGNLTLLPQSGVAINGSLEIVDTTHTTTARDVSLGSVPLTGTYLASGGTFQASGSTSAYTVSLTGNLATTSGGADGTVNLTFNGTAYSGTLNGSGSGSQTSFPNVSGAVTDINGTPVLNATVTFNGVSTTSGQTGLYSILIGSATSGVQTVTASRVVNGVTYTGTNRFALTAGQSAPNVQIPISNPATQGTITGTVSNANGAPLSSAKIVIGAAAPSSANFAFNNLGSIVAYTNSGGVFTIPNVPASNNYTLVASATGQTNATAQGITVTAGNTITRNFTLANAATTNYNLPKVTNFTGLCITTPVNPTRAVGSSAVDSGVLAVRDWILQKRGVLAHRAANPGKIVSKHVPITRAAPAGYVFQSILEWDYTAYDALYGYAILRSLNNTDAFDTYATIQDPLAERFSDGDTILTAGLNYYYNIVRLDVNQNEGAVDGNNTVVLRPLDPIVPVAPLSGASVALPTFQWQAVTNAVNYSIVVYDQFPLPANGTNAATKPFWSQTVTNATSLLYSGPSLTSGQRYYWAVTADDAIDVNPPNYDTTISALSNFTAP